MSDTKWQTTKRAGVACIACGKIGNCNVSPDRTAFKCWKDGGKVHQLKPPGNPKSNGTGYIGKANRPKPATAGKAFDTAEAAIESAGRGTKNGKLAAAWTYTDARGGEVLRVARFDLPDGSKEFRPVHATTAGWKIGDPPGPLPLYRLNEIPAAGVVWVCEGEKATDAAANVLGLAAVTSAHGSSSADKSDWTPLAGRDVVVLPDNDDAGRKYARTVATILAKLEPPARVKVVALPDLPDGGDVVEYIEARDSMESEAIAGSIVALADAVPYIPSADLIGGPVLVCLADVEPTDIDWLWPGRVPLGRITLLVGRPGEGKSFATCDMSARITTGSPWPDGTDCPIGSVILICGEDDPGDTIRPRLDAHHADVRRVHLLTMVRRFGDDGKPHEIMFTLADVAALETALKAHPDCKLIVIDPIGSFLGGSTDAHRDNEVRGVLAPVAQLAAKYGPAVLVVAHRRKSAGYNADETALGSRAFTGIARAVWHLSRDTENKHRRLLLPGKNNLAPEGDGLAFIIAGNPPSILWERDAVAMSADEALAAENDGKDSGPGRPAEERDDAAEWLAAELADLAEHPVSDLRRDAKEAGIAWRTVQRAATNLRVLRERSGFAAGFIWRLPKPGNLSPDAVQQAVSNRANQSCHNAENDNIGTNGTVGELGQERGFSGGASVPESHTCQNSNIGTNGEIDALFPPPFAGFPDGAEGGAR